jgi:hypothetical protein
MSKDTKRILIIAGLVGGAYLLVQAGKGVEQGTENATDNVLTIGAIAAAGAAVFFLI